jgi:hypothetical protein
VGRRRSQHEPLRRRLDKMALGRSIVTAWIICMRRV